MRCCCYKSDFISFESAKYNPFSISEIIHIIKTQSNI